MEYCVNSSTIQWDSQTLTAVSFAPESMLALCTDDASTYLAVTLNQDGTVSQSVPLFQSGTETPMIITAWDGGFATAAYQVVSSDETRLKSVLTVTVYDEAGSTSTQLFSLEGTGCPLFLTAWKDSLFLAVNQEPTTEVCRQADMLYRRKDGTLSQCDVDADVIYSIYLLFQHEYSANFLFTLWKRVRKYGACCTGITQNIGDLLQSHTARTMLANSEFLVLLNQAPTDRLELAKLLNISDDQLSYITDVEVGHGLLKCGSTLVPFEDNFPRNTQLYKLMSTKPSDREL